MTSATDIFSATIRAVDKATAPIRGVVAALRGVTTTQRDVTTASREAAAAQNRALQSVTAHVRVLRGNFNTLSHSIHQSTGALQAFFPMLSAFSAANSLVGLFAMVNKVSQSSAEFQATAAKIGITTHALGSLNFAAKMTEVSVDGMQSGLLKLDKALATAATGKNKDVAGLFAHLKIPLRDAQGHIRNVADVMPQLADAFKNTHDPAMRVRMAMALFGREGAEMLPMLMKGSDGLKAFADESKQLKSEIAPEGFQGLAEFHHQWLLLNTAVKGFTNEVAANVAPALAPIVEMMKNWVVANRDWIAQAIGDRVKELGTWLKTIDIKEVLKSFQKWGLRIEHVFHAVGGLTTAIGALTLAASSPLLSALAGILGIFISLARIIRGVAIGVRVMVTALGPTLSVALTGAKALAVSLAKSMAHLAREFLSFARTAVVAAINGLRSFAVMIGRTVIAAIASAIPMLASLGVAFRAVFTSVLWASPILLAIAAVAGAVYAIYENWKPIKEFFIKLGQDIKKIWDDVTKYIVDTFEAALNRIKRTFSAFNNGWIGRQLNLDDKSRAIHDLVFGDQAARKDAYAWLANAKHKHAANNNNPDHKPFDPNKLIRPIRPQSSVSPNGKGGLAVVPFQKPAPINMPSFPTLTPRRAPDESGNPGGFFGRSRLPRIPTYSVNPDAPRPYPSPYAPGSPAAGSVAASQQPAAATKIEGGVDVTIKLEGAPPGTQVDTRSRGIAREPAVNLGNSSPAFAF